MSLHLLGVRIGADWTSAPSLDAVRGGGGVLKKGMRGAAVAHVQRIVSVPDDGMFGAGTEAAVKKFQETVGLSGTGIVDDETMALIDNAGEGTTYTIHEKAATPAPAIPGALPSSKEKPADRTWLWALLAALGAGGVAYVLSE